MTNRPAIPSEIEREILIESGHRCAVCGTGCPLERAHIVPWNKSRNHNAENLICLCANCHERADNEKWDEKTLREYKLKPWVMRHYERYETEICTKTKITITIDMDFENFDEKNQRWLQSALASFLEISPKFIYINSIEKGSVKITVELQNHAAKKLLQAYKNADQELLEYLNPLLLIGLDSDEYFTNEEKDRFFNLLQAGHHDMRNAVGAILLLTEMMKHEIKENIYDKEKLGSDLDDIAYKARLIMRISRDLNNEISAYRYPDANLIIQDIVEELDPQHVVLKLNLDASISPVFAPRYYFERAINLLIINALESTKPIGGKLNILTEENKTEGQICLRVFEDPIKENYANKPLGQGLGLPMVKDLLSLMGGKMKINWKPGKENEIKLEMKAASKKW